MSEAWIVLRITGLESAFVINRVSAKSTVTGDARQGQTVGGLEPLILVVDQREKRNRRIERGGGFVDEAVEAWLRGGVEDAKPFHRK